MCPDMGIFCNAAVVIHWFCAESEFVGLDWDTDGR